MNTPSQPRHAAVLGAPRSGTTFLMTVVDALPEAEGVTGNLFPIALAHLAARPLPQETREALERGLRGALRDYADSAVYRSRWAAMRKWWLASRRPGELPAAARGQRRETTLVYKEPFLAFAPDLAFDALPESRLVYLVRDGRDVADSLVRKYDTLSDAKLAGFETNEAPLGRSLDGLCIPWWVEPGEEAAFAAADQYVRSIWMWREMNARCQRFLERPDVRASGRVLTVRYEELMADPVGRGQEVAEHLGVRLGARARRRLEEAHGRSLGIHRRRDAASVRAAETLASGQLSRLGYELAH
ncbi:MAG TPA: sulfotransferase [Solirubrobacterales bacterium]|nr:sulfotransferase [Solirubrobacterales bacterium]